LEPDSEIRIDVETKSSKPLHSVPPQKKSLFPRWRSEEDKKTDSHPEPSFGEPVEKNVASGKEAPYVVEDSLRLWRRKRPKE
jgi:hypothetical protein